MKWESEIRDLYEGGMTNGAEIARELGLSRSTISEKLFKMGLRKKSKMSSNTSRYIELHATGISDAEIAAKIGISRRDATKIRLRYGLPLNKGRREIDREFLVREFEESMKALQAHGEHAEVRKKVRGVAQEIGADYTHLMKIYVDELKLIQRRPARKYSDEQYAEAKRLLDNHGLSYTEAQRQTGIPRDRLSSRFPGRGLSPSEAQIVRWVDAKMQKMGI